MTAPLTPALALAYLHELSVDVRAAAVLDATGACLAGDATVAQRARALMARAGDGLPTDGSVLLARTPDGGAIAVCAGDFALLALLRHDLAATAAALATAPADPPGTRDFPS